MVRSLNLIFFSAMIVMNFLANALPLNNKTTGELSDSFPNLFVPAGITFSIWGAIYLLLLLYCILQFRKENSSVSITIGWWFAASSILNAVWIVFWHYGYLPLSLVAMVGILLALVYVNILTSKLPKGIIKAAFGIYLGWICIATIANVTALLVHYNWQRWGISGETWTIFMILAGALISVAAIYRFKNPYIGFSVIWAFTGIILKRHIDYRSIVIAALIAIAVTALATVYGFFIKESCSKE